MPVKNPSEKLRGRLAKINPRLKFDPKPFDQKTIGGLKADIAYVSSKKGSKAEYLYTTDSEGRIKSVHAERLVLKPEGTPRGSYTYRNPRDKRAGDDSGHLIADRFEASGGRDNIVAQLSSLNQGAWKAMEDRWAREISSGKQVSVALDVAYGETGRPIRFDVTEYVTDFNHNKTSIEGPDQNETPIEDLYKDETYIESLDPDEEYVKSLDPDEASTDAPDRDKKDTKYETIKTVHSFRN